jgi:hypothetical protein
VVVVVQTATGAGVLTARLTSPGQPPAAVAGAARDRTVHAAGDREAAARTTAVTALLVRRAAALLRRDRVAFLAGVDPGTPFRRVQARLFDALESVPLTDVAYELDPGPALELPPAAARRYTVPAWGAAVRMRYALAGYDGEPTAQEHYLTFVLRGARWYLGADRDFDTAGRRTARGLWDFGPVAAVRTRRVLVLGHPASLPLMRRILRTADAAVPRVSGVWRDWPGRVVVLVPDSTTELRRVVEHAGDLSQIAAVASADVGVDGGPPAGERVAINPAPFRSLSDFGRQVVLQHEITHVATRDVTSTNTPYWLAEGFADYVGYLDSGATVRSAARELGADVRAGRLPKALPGERDFAGDNPRLAQSYELAWLACRLIAERVGRDGLVRFYRAVSAASGTPAAALTSSMRAELAMTPAEFVAAWRVHLRRDLG